MANVKMYLTSCSMLRDSWVTKLTRPEHENKTQITRSYFRVPFTYASSPLYENLDQAKIIVPCDQVSLPPVPYTCCKILFIIWADSKVVLWELYPQGVIWTVFICCVNKKICLPIKKVSSRDRPLPRYGFFFRALFCLLFILCLVYVFLYPREKNLSIRVSSKLGIWQFVTLTGNIKTSDS